MEAPRIQYARNGEGSVAYAVLGDGPIDLLFVPGFVCNIEVQFELPLSRRFFSRLARSFRLILFDKRGMGLSDSEGGPYTLEGICEDMDAVLDAVGSERAVVFGVSEGGAAATLFAATRPQRTEALVEYGSWARLTTSDDDPIGVPPGELDQLCTWAQENWGNEVTLTLWAPSLAADPTVGDWWGRLLRNSTGPRGAARLLQLYREIDIRPLLGTVNVPTLLLWRDGDGLIPPALTRAVAAGIPDARAVELKGDDHLFLAGDTDRMLGEVEEFLMGRRAEAPAQRGLATVLFTDIVGSTETAASLGDARWREILAEHDRLAKSEVEAERGRLIKSTGDGILAEFDGPARAIAAAQGLGRSTKSLGIDVRAGVHMGECERLGDDIGGIAVHIGARVSSAAGAGEVLVSQTVRDLVVGSGLEFSDRGARELKGVPGEWRLYAVV